MHANKQQLSGKKNERTSNKPTNLHTLFFCIKFLRYFVLQKLSGKSERQARKKKRENMAFPGKPVTRIKFCRANKKNENATQFFCCPSSLSFFWLSYSVSSSFVNSHYYFFFFVFWLCQWFFWHFVLIIHMMGRRAHTQFLSVYLKLIIWWATNNGW